MPIVDRIRSARIVRVFDHGANIQLLCADERGLLSIYFEPEAFAPFYRHIHQAGRRLKGLTIRFDRDCVCLSAPGEKPVLYPVRTAVNA